VAGTLPTPVPEVVRETLVYVDAVDFDFRSVFAITDLHFATESETVTLKAVLDKDVIITVNLSGAVRDVFQIDQSSIHLQTLHNRPRAEFIASTLFALFGLSRETALRVPVIGLDLRQSFDLPLERISRRLQMRQATYRLMVIEQATGMKLAMPERYSGEDDEALTYLYRAIVDRSFVWPVGPITIRVPADRERITLLPQDDIPTPPAVGTDSGRENAIWTDD
jgi:hypothetical protein